MAGAKLIRRLLPLVVLCFSSVAGADVLDDILERGTLRIAVAEFVPWTMKTESGRLIGYEIDVGNKIAKDMGVESDFRLYSWEEVIPALKRGEVDLIAAGLAITPSRALQVEFSRPTAESGVGLATNTRMTQNIETLGDLNDQDIVIATVADTLASDVSRTLFGRADIKTFSSARLAEKEVLDGRAHAYLAAMPEVRFLALKNGAVIDLPISEPLLASSEALAVRRGEQGFLNFLNAWVTSRQSDKWLATTRDYWFGSLDWTDDLTD